MAKTTQAADTAELVTPEEHAATTDELSSPAVDVAALANPDEVAARSADMEEASDKHRKVFVLGPDPVGDNVKNPYTEGRGYDHDANKIATRQGAINAGLWPTGDVEFVSGKKHPDGESWVLSYDVPVVPAGDADVSRTHPTVVGSVEVTRNDEGIATEAIASSAVNYGDEQPNVLPDADEPTA